MVLACRSGTVPKYYLRYWRTPVTDDVCDVSPIFLFLVNRSAIEVSSRDNLYDVML